MSLFPEIRNIINQVKRKASCPNLNFRCLSCGKFMYNDTESLQCNCGRFPTDFRKSQWVDVPRRIAFTVKEEKV